MTPDPRAVLDTCPAWRLSYSDTSAIGYVAHGDGSKQHDCSRGSHFRTVHRCECGYSWPWDADIDEETDDA